ncbi:hypothetical protein [Atlantibacter hermannii]|uniref:hypothetical protein n=1 Tax=Atlantibacter hermannii TaxID=565 RepID=UPI0033216738
MKINERVSPERLDTIKSWRETYGQDANVMIPASEAESIISELQQYRAAAEPVCPKCGGTGMADSGGFYPWGEPIFIECDCHAAPQLPQPAVVPDAIEIDDDFDSAFEHGKAVGWNAYRAAMLQGTEPVSQPYTLPECFERLFKHAQGLTFGVDWNHGTAAKYHRDLLIKTVDDCRAAIASGYSSAIPDGWTGSGKANAALVMLDRIDTLDPVDDDRIEGIKRIIRELASAPKQEAE